MFSSKECSLLLPVTLSETDLKGITSHVQFLNLLKVNTQVRAGDAIPFAAYGL